MAHASLLAATPDAQAPTSWRAHALIFCPKPVEARRKSKPPKVRSYHRLCTDVGSNSMTGASEVDVVGIEEVQVRLQRRVEELQMDRVRVQRSVRAALNACPTQR